MALSGEQQKLNLVNVIERWPLPELAITDAPLL